MYMRMSTPDMTPLWGTPFPDIRPSLEKRVPQSGSCKVLITHHNIASEIKDMSFDAITT
jgi:hypothetical protein